MLTFTAHNVAGDNIIMPAFTAHNYCRQSSGVGWGGGVGGGGNIYIHRQNNPVYFRFMIY